MSVRSYVLKTVKAAKDASYAAAQLTTKKKNAVLRDMAAILDAHAALLIRENGKDIAYAEKNGISSAMIDRLRLDKKRIAQMARAIRDVAGLPDPVGAKLAQWKRPNGLRLEKVSVPLGVILIIYEARPNVTSECASLCLKSGNVVILRGGKESFHSNAALVALFKKVLKKHGLPESSISFVDTTDRAAVDELLVQDAFINLVIPRGGEGLIRKVVARSTIPVIKHYKGICHVFVDASASLTKALSIALNAKCQRPSVCNAMECLLVHEKIAKKFLPVFAARFAEAGGVLYGCRKTRALVKTAKAATPKQYATEYLDLRLSVKVVKNVSEAVEHINTYGSGHTDAIVSTTKKNIDAFVAGVDSSSVMVNASTRFSDGNEYGFGAEIGISTDKLHARGPMGLEGLTSYKYIVRGTGQIRE